VGEANNEVYVSLVLQVQAEIESVGNTLTHALKNCFSMPDLSEIIKVDIWSPYILCVQAMVGEFEYVHRYLDSVKDFKETLTDPNKGLSVAELRLGKRVPYKVCSEEEKNDEKVLLGNIYKDKEFLREVNCTAKV
jgi:hypothetical protein